MKNRRTFLALLLFVLLAAMGSLLASASTGRSADRSAPAIPPASAPAPAPATAGATVTISNFAFTPKVVRITAGSEVTWQVKEGTHTVNADDGGFESPALSAGQKFSYKFATAGTYRYYCSFHGAKGGHDMAGTVIVTK